MAAHQAPPSWDSPVKNTGVGCYFLLQTILLLLQLNNRNVGGQINRRGEWGGKSRGQEGQNPLGKGSSSNSIRNKGYGFIREPKLKIRFLDRKGYITALPLQLFNY